MFASVQNSESTPTNSNEASEIDTAGYTPNTLPAHQLQKYHPAAFPVVGHGAAEEFNRICQHLDAPAQILVKKDIVWSKKDPLHFWQSLAFILRSKELTSVAVSSFVDTTGQNKLYIASNNPMTPSQQQEVTNIINMFLNMKPLEDIVAQLLPRHLPYLINQFKKCLRFLGDFIKDFPGELVSTIKTLSVQIISDESLSLDDMRPLMNLIVKYRKELGARRDRTSQNTSQATKKMAIIYARWTELGRLFILFGEKFDAISKIHHSSHLQSHLSLFHLAVMLNWLS